MLRWHRLCAAFAAILLAYVAVTGTGIQLADMRALLSGAPATDPDMLMMRQHIQGPPNYAVVSAPDYTAKSLPNALDYRAAIARAAALGRAAAPGAQLRLVELRMAGSRVAGHVQMADRHFIFDLTSGTPLPAADLPPQQPPRDFVSTRSTFKYFHRFNYLGQFGTALNALAGIALAILIFTGLGHYLRLYKARQKMRRRSPFWKAGDGWRNLHRWTALAASIPIVWLTVSGLLLSLDNVGVLAEIAIHGAPQGVDPFAGDLSTPLTDGELAPMTDVTLAAFHNHAPNTALKVLRLRYFVGYPQGVVVAADRNTTQLVFNARTGQSMSMSEKGYPNLGFPAGWEWHQRLKLIHRGDIAGLPGRWIDLIGALALLYMITSGSVMYFHLWKRRRKAGKAALIWR